MNPRIAHAIDGRRHFSGRGPDLGNDLMEYGHAVRNLSIQIILLRRFTHSATAHLQGHLQSCFGDYSSFLKIH